LRRVIDQMDSEDGWVHLGEVGKRVTNLAPDFDPRTYGHAKLSDLVLKTGSFDVDRPEGRGVRIRLKQVPKEKPARPSEAPVKHRPL
jgi:Fe-S-cluster formation regulator IscX/YfhJ